MSNTWLVIPSNRIDNLSQFLDAWYNRGGWDKIVIVEDAPQKTNEAWLKSGEANGRWLHYSHAEIKEVLGEDSWIISKRDSAIRCFGFLLAWWGGAERVLTLDDDVRPDDERPFNTSSFVEDHVAAMRHQRWASSVFGMRVRGLPYKNHGELPDVVANVGLWTEHMDFDAVTQLSMIGSNSIPFYGLPNSNWIIPHGQFAPICGMNLMLERKALPLAYFPLMGEGQPFARFDDIWMGVIFKHCCDALGWHVSVGKPFVRHDKASDPFVNLRKEAPGIGVNETFWERIASIRLKSDNAFGCMVEIGEHLKIHAEHFRDSHSKYWFALGQAMHKWTSTFATKPAGLKL